MSDDANFDSYAEPPSHRSVARAWPKLGPRTRKAFVARARARVRTHPRTRTRTRRGRAHAHANPSVLWLQVSALQKIARIMKLPVGLKLYRGMGGRMDLPGDDLRVEQSHDP